MPPSSPANAGCCSSIAGKSRIVGRRVRGAGPCYDNGQRKPGIASQALASSCCDKRRFKQAGKKLMRHVPGESGLAAMSGAPSRIILALGRSECDWGQASARSSRKPEVAPGQVCRLTGFPGPWSVFCRSPNHAGSCGLEVFADKARVVFEPFPYPGGDRRIWRVKKSAHWRRSADSHGPEEFVALLLRWPIWRVKMSDAFFANPRLVVEQLLKLTLTGLSHVHRNDPPPGPDPFPGLVAQAVASVQIIRTLTVLTAQLGHFSANGFA